MLPSTTAAPNNNKVAATLYNLDQFNGIELPNVYYGINAAESAPVSSATVKKRYFPAALIARDTAAYKTRVDAFNTLKAAYDILKDAYNAKVEQQNVKYSEFDMIFNRPVPILIPERPAAPSPVAAYDGFSWGTNVESTTTSPNKILLD